MSSKLGHHQRNELRHFPLEGSVILYRIFMIATRYHFAVTAIHPAAKASK
jgi:hypothetical protein